MASDMIPHLAESHAASLPNARNAPLAIKDAVTLRSDSVSPLDFIQVRADVGTGRVFILLAELEREEEGKAVFSSMTAASTSNDGVQKSPSYRVIFAVVPALTKSNFEPLTEALVSTLEKYCVRQASFIAFGSAGSLVQRLALHELKLVRTLILIDAETRPHPTGWELFLNRLEAHLPLGLPFRSNVGGFFSTPFLQRIRCPALILTTPDASSHVRMEARIFEERLPTAWRHELARGEDPAQIIFSFQEVPAKCPQKSRK